MIYVYMDEGEHDKFRVLLKFICIANLLELHCFLFKIVKYNDHKSCNSEWNLTPT